MEKRLIAATKELETLRQAADPEALRTLRRELSETKRDAKEFRRQVAAFEAERAEAQSARRAMAQEKNLPRLQAAMSPKRSQGLKPYCRAPRASPKPKRVGQPQGSRVWKRSSPKRRK